MLIKCKSEQNLIYINFDRISKLEKYFDNQIRFMFDDYYEYIFFETEEMRDKAMENILDSYKWQRITCDLEVLN